jgi:anaerobic ribonucleoside-triphosphate reductase
MAKKYSKEKLIQFRISIEKRMEEIAEDMGDIHDGILDNSNNSERLSRSPSSVFIWPMQGQTLLSRKKIIY